MTGNARRVSLPIVEHETATTLLFHVTARNPFTQNPLVLAVSPYINLRDIPVYGLFVNAHENKGTFFIQTFISENDGESITLQGVTLKTSLSDLWGATVASLGSEFPVHGGGLGTGGSGAA